MGGRKRRKRKQVNPYRVGFSATWDDDMRMLHHRNRPAHQEAERMVEAIKVDPHKVGHLLVHGEWAGSRAVELGIRRMFRMLWDVSEDDPKTIIFRTIGERKDVYERPKPE